MTGSDIVCVECKTCPRLLSLKKNSGTYLGCNCDDVQHSMDMVPYELTIHDLPDSWVVVEGRAARQLSHEVDLCLEADVYECPACKESFGITETRRSCQYCGYIPERNRWTPESDDEDRIEAEP